MSHKHAGFTLIELSIVLVIIGLVVGGILAGSDLIRTAELNTIITQKTKYSVAFNTFRTKYNALPGDMSNATQYWGAAAGSAADNYVASCQGSGSASSPLTCNGDGNGYICGGADYWSFLCTEGVMAWQQLANAGLIEGTYTPITAPTGGSYEVVGLNIPVSKVRANAGFSIFYHCLTGSLGNEYFANGHCAHTFFYGAQDSGTNSNWMGLAFYPALSALDAQRIDSKLDNGLPATGTVTTTPTGGAYGNSCTTTTVVSTAKYTVTVPGITCMLMFNADGF
ncbi:MAG TPA: prepilin-type N-terminal cleavage/methylation domain-containing protein [Rickettsiales bacterium]|nr:prepilin-type N-terminal cleavage/methylation domain-containing protein [Rickettsiales bacterium]